MTTERKAELYKELINWVYDHSYDMSDYARALKRMRFTYEEIRYELYIECCVDEDEIQAIIKELKGE